MDSKEEAKKQVLKKEEALIKDDAEKIRKLAKEIKTLQNEINELAESDLFKNYDKVVTDFGAELYYKPSGERELLKPVLDFALKNEWKKAAIEDMKRMVKEYEEKTKEMGKLLSSLEKNDDFEKKLKKALDRM